MTTLHNTSPSQTWLSYLLRRKKAIIVIAVTLFALLSAGAVLAQSSTNFGLACQQPYSNGGGTISNSTHGLTIVLGVPIAPKTDSATAPTYSVRSTNYGIRAGFLPGYPTEQSTAASVAPAAGDQFDDHQLLPLLYKVGSFLGGC